MQKESKIYVAGHRGLVGSAICRELEKQGCTNIIFLLSFLYSKLSYNSSL